MSALSNLFRPRDAKPPVFRPVVRAEIEASIRLIVGGNQRQANDEQVLDFLSFALGRGIDVNQAWVADCDGRVEFALLPVVSPGRTMLLFSPARPPRRMSRQIIRGLSDAVNQHYALRGVHLSQILIDPRERPTIDAFLFAGYSVLAELVYLQTKIENCEQLPALPPGWSIVLYSSENHAIFAQTIAQSYQGSLDCPELNGMRSVEDVIAGHKAAGDFDPRLWFSVVENGQPLGVLLLNRSAGNPSVELVYIGTIPAARGRGVGDFLLRYARAVASLENRQYLSLAVDLRNTPALRLYYRHQLMRVGSRLALLRDLRPLTHPGALPQENFSFSTPAAQAR
jgi:ribosomal protein S18 acetylase RimI-like enzyme